MSPSAYKTFESSPGIIRGFCKECGGSLTWYDTKRSDIEILVGTVDDIKGAGFEITNMVYQVIIYGLSNYNRVLRKMRSRDGKSDRGISRNEGSNFYTYLLYLLFSTILSPDDSCGD